MNNPSKGKILFACLFACLLCFVFGAAEKSFAKQQQEPLPADIDIAKEVTGMEWLELSLQERMDIVVRGMGSLTTEGVRVTDSPRYYADAIEKRLRFDTALHTLSVQEIIRKIIQEKGAKR